MTISWQLFECKSNTRWSLTELFSPLATKRTELLGWRNMNRRTHHSQAGIGSLIIDPSCFDWTLFLEGWVLLIKLQVGRLVKEWKANVYNLRYFIYIYIQCTVYIYICVHVHIITYIYPSTDRYRQYRGLKNCVESWMSKSLERCPPLICSHTNGCLLIMDIQVQTIAEKLDLLPWHDLSLQCSV